ncbi:hypothetical protein AX14_007627 [Amanita brunnescens Koide BX004]|nr:hypothetical protein AX14_007627 [Amanita brunnescens Koide BX004]
MDLPFHSRPVIASYCLVVLLALPLWWSTTSILRLALPAARVHVHEHTSLQLPVHVLFSDSPAAARDLRAMHDSAPERWKGLHLRLDQASSEDTYIVLDDPITSVSGRTLRTSSNAADTLAALLAPALSSRDAEQRVAQYSPRYRLAFSLLNEDAAAQHAILGWEVTKAIRRTFTSIRQSLLYPSRG